MKKTKAVINYLKQLFYARKATKAKKAYIEYQTAIQVKVNAINKQFIQDLQLLDKELILCKSAKKIQENVEKRDILTICKDDAITIIKGN